MIASMFVFTLFITAIFSKTFICNDSICDFGVCTDSKCTGNTYICTSSAIHCELECVNCNNITIISSAQDTEILCDYKNCCNQVSIDIQSESSTDHNSLVLTCSHSTSCTDINILCNNDNNLCQCKDFDDIQCNTNVNGDFSLWYSHPSIIRKYIINNNKTNETIANQTNIDFVEISTSAQQTSSIYTTNIHTDGVQNNDINKTYITYEPIFIMVVVLFCISVCFGVFMYFKKPINKIIENVNVNGKKDTIDSPSSTTQILPVPTLASSTNSAMSIISVASQSSLDTQSPKCKTPNLQLQTSQSAVSVSLLNIPNVQEQV